VYIVSFIGGPWNLVYNYNANMVIHKNVLPGCPEHEGESRLLHLSCEDVYQTTTQLIMVHLLKWATYTGADGDQTAIHNQLCVLALGQQQLCRPVCAIYSNEQLTHRCNSWLDRYTANYVPLALMNNTHRGAFLDSNKQLAHRCSSSPDRLQPVHFSTDRYTANYVPLAWMNNTHTQVQFLSNKQLTHRCISWHRYTANYVLALMKQHTHYGADVDQRATLPYIIMSVHMSGHLHDM
jgi:hypothetical protein